MKRIFVLVGLVFTIAVAVLMLSSSCVFADDTTNKTDFAPEVAVVTAQLKEKFDADKITQRDLAENLKAINALIVKHFKDKDREQLARLYLLDAHIYADGLKDTAKARARFSRYPGRSRSKFIPGTIRRAVGSRTGSSSSHRIGRGAEIPGLQ